MKEKQVMVDLRSQYEARMRRIKNINIKCGVSLLIVSGVLGMSVVESAESGSAGENFGMVAMGGPQFGSDRINVQMNGNTLVVVSHTINKENFHGVGIYANRMRSEHLDEAKQIHRLLCENEGKRVVPDKPSFPIVRSIFGYSAVCIREQEVVQYQGSVDDLPSSLRDDARSFFNRVFDTYVAGSRTDAKLDVAVENIEHKNNKLLVTVRLINSGVYPLTFHKPGNPNESVGATHLSIQAKGANGNGWTMGLPGSLLANEAEFSGDSVTIPPRSSVTFKFLTVPNEKVASGTYSVDAQAMMSLSHSEAPANALGIVDFHSDYKNPTTITLDRDYPSTPEEWKDYESRKAKTVSPVPPGASITEPGYYRAASAFGTSALLKSFKADEQAPEAPADIQFAKWHWVADLARAVTCAPGEACPRDGRWLLSSRGRYYGNPDQTYPQHERHMSAGEVSPLVSIAHVNDRDLYWTWQGA